MNEQQMTDINLNEIKARAAEAKALANATPPGPWLMVKWDGDFWVGTGNGNSIQMGWSHEAEAKFISESRALVPQLCDDIAALTARVEEMEQQVNAYHAWALAGQAYEAQMIDMLTPEQVGSIAGLRTWEETEPTQPAYVKFWVGEAQSWISAK